MLQDSFVLFLFLKPYQVDEQRASMDPKSGAAFERSECSTDPRKRRRRDRYQTYTVKEN